MLAIPDKDQRRPSACQALRGFTTGNAARRLTGRCRTRAVIHGTVTAGHFFAWLSAVPVGNILGGVAIVALLNYGQIRAGEE